QLVKGTVEDFDVSFETAALRELVEESGIEKVESVRYLGFWDSGYQHQIWHLLQCKCGDLPDKWTFRTQDDGGHDFAFFWHKFNDALSFECQDVFVRAIKHVIRISA
ncbi:MAG: NUDIX domain-containing protein, partial [Photobacterium halotolerans]